MNFVKSNCATTQSMLIAGSKAGSKRRITVGLARAYSRNSHLRQKIAELQKRIETSQGCPQPAPSEPPKRRKPRRTLQEVEEIVAAYEAGSSTNQLVKQYGIAKETLLAMLRERNVAIRYQPLDDDTVQRVVDLYASGLSFAKVGCELGIAPMTVSNTLKRAGVPVRGTHERRGKG